MSNEVLPRLPGQTLKQGRASTWNNTVRKTKSGRTFARSHWVTLVRELRIEYEFLRAGAEAELQQLEGFFNRHKGDGDTWLFDDENDRTVVAEPFGVGNSIATAFQLVRSRGGFVEPVYELNGPPLIHADAGDWRGRFLCYDYSRVNRARTTQNAATWTFYQNDMGAITPAAGVAPDGTNTASALIPDGNLSDHFVDSYEAFGGGTGHYTWAVYFKPSGFDSLRLQIAFGGGSDNFLADFNVTTGVVSNAQGYGTAIGTVNAGVESAPDGYIRAWVSGLVSDVGAPIQRFQMLGPGGESVFAGNGVDGVLVWGWQLERSPVPTRYIPSLGAAGSTAPPDFTLGANGLVNFTTALATGTLIDWTGDYFWRCRFTRSAIDFEQFLHDLWNLRQLEFVTDKP